MSLPSLSLKSISMSLVKIKKIVLEKNEIKKGGQNTAPTGPCGGSNHFVPLAAGCPGGVAMWAEAGTRF